MKQKILIVFCSLIYGILLYFSIAAGYRNLARWIFLEDRLPQHLDYICTFAGSPEREPYALGLIKKYQDALWIADTERKHFKDWVEENGVDSNRIIITPPCESTFQEMWNFRRIINMLEKKERNSKKKPIIGFVSSNYHMRRISLLFALAKGKRFKNGLFLPAPVDKEIFSTGALNTWWKNGMLRGFVESEAKKIAGNIILYGLLLKVTS